MNRIWILAKKELASFFDSLIAYVIIILFLGLTGGFTWLAPNNVFFLGQANMGVFFNWAFMFSFVFIPAITMKMLAEENRSGTIELLITKSISDWEIVFGKFLACLLLVLIWLVCTIPFYITIANLGPIDHGATLGGYFGLICLSAALISIGIFASSLTNNQIIAFLISIMIGLVFQVGFGVVASALRGGLGNVFQYMTLSSHFESISRGVIDTRDLIYFGGIIVLGLVLSQVMLSKRNWQV